MTRIQASDELKIAFNFNNADLQDNRQGFMSYRQKRWLWFKALLKGEWLSVLITFIIIMSIGYSIIVFVLPDITGIVSITAYGVFSTCSAAIYLLVGMLIVFGIGWAHLPQYYRDIRAGKVSRIQIQVNSQGRCFGCEGSIKLSKSQLASLRQNYTYHLYYAPNTSEILSIEIVRVDKGLKDT